MGLLAAWYTWAISIASTFTFVVCGLGVALYRSSLPTVPSAGVLAIGGAILLVAIGLGWQYREIAVRQWLSTHQNAIILLGACGGVVSSFVVVLFSVEAASGGRFPNVIAHGTGFVTGLSVAVGGLRLL